MTQYIAEVDDSNFKQTVLVSKHPVLVDFGRRGAGRACRSGRSWSLSPSSMRERCRSSS